MGKGAAICSTTSVTAPGDIDSTRSRHASAIWADMAVTALGEKAGISTLRSSRCRGGSVKANISPSGSMNWSMISAAPSRWYRSWLSTTPCAEENRSGRRATSRMSAKRVRTNRSSGA